jgi:ferredoxin
MRVSIDRERCTGHGRCYMVAAGVFGDDDDGYGVVTVDEANLTPDLVEQAALAAASCPEGAVVFER